MQLQLIAISLLQQAIGVSKAHKKHLKLVNHLVEMVIDSLSEDIQCKIGLSYVLKWVENGQRQMITLKL